MERSSESLGASHGHIAVNKNTNFQNWWLTLDNKGRGGLIILVHAHLILK